MDSKAVKLALARQKLKSHQDKKHENVKTESTVPVSNENNSIFIIDTAEVSKENHTDAQKSCSVQESDLAELLISNKRNLESEISALQTKLLQLEHDYNTENESKNSNKQQIETLVLEVNQLRENCSALNCEIKDKNTIINELLSDKFHLTEEKSSLLEQLEFIKSVISSKDIENTSLKNQLADIQNQLEVTQIQIQQINCGQPLNSLENKTATTTELNEYLTKINNLEEQLKKTTKDKEQLSAQYELFVANLNNELKNAVVHNENLQSEVQNLSIRENSLIEHISEMEIRMNNLYSQKNNPPMEEPKISSDLKEMDKKCKCDEYKEMYASSQENLTLLSSKYNDLHNQYLEITSKLAQSEENDISLSKLNADITSDKVAAQKATEQNKKMKNDILNLEEAYIKMSQDKLELTEKLTAEKHLNKELVLRLADTEEKDKELQMKLKAKDDEMMRLQSLCRHLEEEKHQHIHQPSEEPCNHLTMDTNCNNNEDSDSQPLVDGSNSEIEVVKKTNIAKENAMEKLQERFTKIMAEVADLSDEKYRLEHIIMQLQNETETICEYVALYQQQRNLLKKRDQDRCSEIIMFQAGCDGLRRHLDDLTSIITRLSQDKVLAAHLQTESRRTDIQYVMLLLQKLKSSYLLKNKWQHYNLDLIYPCHCCIGTPIDV